MFMNGGEVPVDERERQWCPSCTGVLSASVTVLRFGSSLCQRMLKHVLVESVRS